MAVETGRQEPKKMTVSVIKVDIGGCDVVGILDGFKWPMEGSTSQVRPSSIKE
jgi:6-phosphofructokinase 1